MCHQHLHWIQNCMAASKKWTSHFWQKSGQVTFGKKWTSPRQVYKQTQFHTLPRKNDTSPAARWRSGYSTRTRTTAKVRSRLEQMSIDLSSFCQNDLCSFCMQRFNS